MDGIKKHVRKAFAYITHGRKLLVFEQPDAPEAGIQVPAGSIEPNEAPADAARREAHEETGLKNLRLVRFLGQHTYDMSRWKPEIHQRYFYHLVYDSENIDASWEHGERFPSDQPDHDGSITHLFRLFWVDSDACPPLIAGHDHFLEKLRGFLRTNEESTQHQ
ncbi:MAG: NUDIX domain-containing protein [Chloroflexota bacterium]